MARKTDLNLLLALDALLTERNVTRAAARLGTSQPALSAQLVRLRAMFDDPLLLPGSRGMTPTPRALELAPRLSGLINEFMAIVEPDTFDPATAEMTILVSCVDVMLNTMASSFAKWHEMAPSMRFGFLPLSQLSRPDTDNRLASGQFDVLIGPQSLMPERTHVRQVTAESFVCCIRADHPFRKRTMSMDDLCALKHVMVSPLGGSFSGNIDAALAEHGKARTVVASVPNFMLAEQILRQSDFAAVLPRSLAVDLKGGLRAYELPAAIPTGQIYVGWHERTHHSPAHRWFREQLFDVFRHRKIVDDPPDTRPGALIQPAR